MAIESQGIQFRRQSTTAGSTGASSGAVIAFSTASSGVTRSAGDFTAENWSTGMRMENDSTSNSTRVHTIATIAATVMTVYESVISQATGISFALIGHDMEAVAEISGFNGPSGSANVIDVTNLGSTAKEKLIGLRDEGQLSLDLMFNTDTTALQIALKDDRASRTRRVYDLVLTDQSTTAGSQPTALFMDAYVTGFALTGAVDDTVKASITLEITSAVKTIEKV